MSDNEVIKSLNNYEMPNINRKENDEIIDLIKFFGLDIKSLVKFKYENKKLKQENKKLNKIIDEMATMLEKAKITYFKKEEGGELLGKYRCYNKDDWKQYFEEKVEDKIRWEK